MEKFLCNSPPSLNEWKEDWGMEKKKKEWKPSQEPEIKMSLFTVAEFRSAISICSVWPADIYHCGRLLSPLCCSSHQISLRADAIGASAPPALAGQIALLPRVDGGEASCKRLRFDVVAALWFGNDVSKAADVVLSVTVTMYVFKKGVDLHRLSITAPSNRIYIWIRKTNQDGHSWRRNSLFLSRLSTFSRQIKSRGAVMRTDGQSQNNTNEMHVTASITWPQVRPAAELVLRLSLLDAHADTIADQTMLFGCL